MVHEISEELDFKDRVINMALGHSHLIVTTVPKCYVYHIQNWTTCQQIDLKENVTLIHQSST